MHSRKPRSARQSRAVLDPNPDAEAPRFGLKSAGVDWLTVTCRDGETRDRFHDVGYSLIEVEAHAGANVKPWTFEQFKGLNAGEVALGEADEMSVMRLSGPCAWSNWRRVYALATNCSRIDFQVTVAEVPDPLALILEQHQKALDHIADWRRPPSVQLRMHNRRGHTLYLGERTSDRFGRLYDKGRESKLEHYQGCVRAEVQFNKRAARTAAASLAKKGLSPTEVIPFVTHYFHIRGISQLWPGADRALINVPRSRSNAERRLSWLAAQVRPAVQSLIEAGLLQETVSALGLSDAHLDQMVLLRENQTKEKI